MFVYISVMRLNWISKISVKSKVIKTVPIMNLASESEEELDDQISPDVCR